MFDYAERRRRLAERMEGEGVDVLFLAPSADLEYLTGVERHVPSFGEASYAHGWVTGAFFRRNGEPVFVLPRMFAAFDLREEPPGERDLDSQTATGRDPIAEGTSVMFDFGGVVDGYCSDFGRTVYCGEPPADYRDVYEIMLAAQEAGRAAARAGAPAQEVNAACRRPIEDAGLGEHFRHRMGHGIGLDVHERPFISPEDETPLEPGMTFTDEPSIIVPGRFSVRIEDIVVCEEGGGRKLGSYSDALVAN